MNVIQFNSNSFHVISNMFYMFVLSITKFDWCWGKERGEKWKEKKRKTERKYGEKIKYRRIQFKLQQTQQQQQQQNVNTNNTVITNYIIARAKT